ncbi:MAG: S1C family serine protease [Clostridia bacterium]|nr:S1C family serine protease [Clostridia bacterium]
MGKKLISLILCITICLFPLEVIGATAKPKPPAKKVLTVKEISKKSNAVVLLNIIDKNNDIFATGSGFIVSKDGKIITNYHVIDTAEKIEAVMYDNTTYEVDGIVNYDKGKDIAVLKISSNKPLPYVTLGDSNKIELGDNIVAIGSPLGLKNTVSTGIVSSIRENMYRDAFGCTDIQISAPISHGSSGGVLFNMYGEAIGITYAGISQGENLNFAIPINEAKPLLNYGLIPINAVTQEDKKSNDDLLKFYAKILDEYNCFRIMGESLRELNTNLLLACSISINSNPTTSINTCNNSLNSIIDLKNKQINVITSIVETANIYNIDVSGLNSIMNKYYDSIEYYKKSIDSLILYSVTKSSNDFSTFTSDLNKAFSYMLEGKIIADKEYVKNLNDMQCVE